MKYLLVLLLFAGSVSIAFSQEYSVRGTILERGTPTAMPFVNVLILTVSDSAQVAGTVTDMDGRFEFARVREGEYILKVQYIGYQSIFQTISVKSNLNLGNIQLKEDAQSLSEVIVEARRSTGGQKSDTTMFNADAFKTMKDASAQALIEKLPGVQVQDGVVTAQGENIAQILVDGKPFFGTDVKTALQNLPAEIIDRIEIFDQKSEKAQLSGFDDGERLKTINIITKPNRRKGQFGRGTLGYGSDDRYLAGVSVNLFDEDRRITLTGLSNNVNILNYSSDPNAQDGSNPQRGIITTNILGMNFSNNWGQTVKLTGSYVYSDRENVGIVDRFREFVTADESSKLYSETARDVRVNKQHQADMRLEWKPNDRDRILYIPRFSARYESENSGFYGETTDGTSVINTVENVRTGYYQDYDLVNRIIYGHKFSKPGRSITFRGISTQGWNIDDAQRLARNTFIEEETETEEILDQKITRERTGNSWQARVSYTEPVGKRGQTELEYQIGNRKNDSDKLTYNVEDRDMGGGRLEIDTALSNVFNSRYFFHEFEWGYQYTTEKMKLQAEVEYQNADLTNVQDFPSPSILERNFVNLLPTLRYEYKFSPTVNIQLDYDTYTNEPQINQLQEVIDNSNPLQLRTGNPNLDQAYTNDFRLRFRGNNPDTDRNWFVFAQSRLTNNFIANSTFIANEPTQIQDGIILERGSQLNKPVNLDGFVDLRSWFSFGMPIGFIKSNFNLNAGLGYTQRPGQVNDAIGFNNSMRLSTGFSVNSSISDQIDFNIWSRSSFNEVRNTLNPNLNNDFFQQRFRVNLNWIIWEGIIYRLDLNHQINTGLSQGFNANFSLVNMSVGKKLFPNQRGELSLMVYDLLGQNANVNRNISDTFIEDIQTNVLQRYFMLSFSYNLRRFSKGMDEKKYEEMYQSNQ